MNLSCVGSHWWDEVRFEWQKLKLFCISYQQRINVLFHISLPLGEWLGLTLSASWRARSYYLFTTSLNSSFHILSLIFIPDGILYCWRYSSTICTWCTKPHNMSISIIYGSSRHGLIRKTPQWYHESNILLLFSPYWARCERPCKEKRTAALSVVRSWYGSAESPEGGIGRVCYKWCLQAWSCQSISSQLTCLMMSTRYFFTALVGKDLPRKSWKWTCGLSPVTSTNLSSKKTHILHSVSNACGLNLSSVQKLWSVFTKARPWGKELKDINSMRHFQRWKLSVHIPLAKYLWVFPAH